jgi:endonuclease G, mitochondrial
MKYDENFLAIKIPLPKLSKKQLLDTETNPETKEILLRHHDNYSVALSKSRRLAWYSCANLDATAKQVVKRSQLTSSWKSEADFEKTSVLGGNWYKKSEELLDRGHLTPADAMEWGLDDLSAINKANSTFFYSNAAPQHKELNRNEWRMLEAFVSDECLKSGYGRLNVFTGSVLAADDPEYAKHQEVDFKLKIPRLFWKVIYYYNDQKQVCRLGFLMGQTELLEKSNLTVKSKVDGLEATGPFADLGKNKTYQVSIALIEKLSGLKMPKAKEEHKKEDPQELTLQEVELELESMGKAVKKEFRLVGLKM